MEDKEKIYIVVADNGCIYAVKAFSKQESLKLVMEDCKLSAEEIASRELEEMFQVLGENCKVTMIN